MLWPDILPIKYHETYKSVFVCLSSDKVSPNLCHSQNNFHSSWSRKEEGNFGPIFHFLLLCIVYYCTNGTNWPIIWQYLYNSSCVLCLLCLDSMQFTILQEQNIIEALCISVGHVSRAQPFGYTQRLRSLQLECSIQKATFWRKDFCPSYVDKDPWSHISSINYNVLIHASSRFTMFRTQMCIKTSCVKYQRGR